MHIYQEHHNNSVHKNNFSAQQSGNTSRQPSIQFIDHRSEQKTLQQFQNMADEKSQAVAQCSIIQREGEDIEKPKSNESWGDWFSRHKYKFLAIGIVTVTAAAWWWFTRGSFSSSTPSKLPTPEPQTLPMPQPDKISTTVSTKSDKESIWVKSFRQAISGPQQGDEAPPYPDLDGVGDMLEMVTKPLISKGLDQLTGKQNFGEFE